MPLRATVSGTCFTAASLLVQSTTQCMISLPALNAEVTVCLADGPSNLQDDLLRSRARLGVLSCHFGWTAHD